MELISLTSSHNQQMVVSGLEGCSVLGLVNPLSVPPFPHWSSNWGYVDPHEYTYRLLEVYAFYLQRQNLKLASVGATSG